MQGSAVEILMRNNGETWGHSGELFGTELGAAGGLIRCG